MFKRKQPEQPAVQTQTTEEYAAALRGNAIEYIVSLKKTDKDRFIEAVELIWQGYQRLDNVKTETERALATERRKMGISDGEDDDMLGGFLEDEVETPNRDLPKGEA
jgi:hypothetical protein